MSCQETTAIAFGTTRTAVTGPCSITALGLSAGSDAATASFYDGNDASAPLRWKLSAAATATSSIAFCNPLRFKTACYVVLSGTAPTASVAIIAPQSAQLE